MEISQLIEETLYEIEDALQTALKGLTLAEIIWRPSDEVNAIGFTLWHQARVEDSWVSNFALKVPQIFERDGWSKKWVIPAFDTGFGYTTRELTEFVTPPVPELLEYAGMVRMRTCQYLSGLAAGDFDFVPETDHPWRQGYTIGRMFGHMVCELSQHLGHIRYLRGLQRGLNN